MPRRGFGFSWFKARDKSAWGRIGGQPLVAANRELIARFEKKIQVTLARVWGEEA